jgi:hypothetical protein
VTIGADIGQRVDPTAIAVVETIEAVGEGEYDYQPLKHYVRRLERLPLGTKYPAVARRLCDIAAQLQGPERDPWLLMDATGVGQPVVDLVVALMERRGIECKVVACYFTHGDRLDWQGREARVGKAYLVSALQAALQQTRLLFPPTLRDARQLQDELLNYEIRVDQDANDKYGAFAVGAHDDEVTAVGLALVGGMKRVSSGHVAVAVSNTDPSLFEQLARRAEDARRAQAQALSAAQATAGTSTDLQQEWERLERERQQAEHAQALARMLARLGALRSIDRP